MSIILTLIIFSIVVVIHEGGHFLIARKNDIYVEEFAIGMGPILLKKQGEETLYTLRALPIGGFCRMRGEDTESNDPQAFSNKPVKGRIEVVVAGVIMNLILGLLIFFMLMSYEGFYTTTISSVSEGYPAYEVGLQAGDKILELNGEKVTSYNDFSFKMQSTSPEDVQLLIDRNGEDILFEMDLQYNEEQQRYMMGFAPLYRIGYLRSNETVDSVAQNYENSDAIAPTKAGFFETIWQTFMFIWFYFYATVASLIGLFTGQLGLSTMSGPIGIVSVVGSEYQAAAAIGLGVVFESMLSLLGTLSLALAVFNILPIPALDGGRLVFLIIEGVRGKPVDPDKEGTIHFVGFVALMLLAVVVAFSDVFKLIQ